MNAFIKRNSKLIAALLGVLVGIHEGVRIGEINIFPKIGQEHLLTVVAIGMFAPLAAALFNSSHKDIFGAAFMKKANEYVNLYYYMIVASFVLGATGLITLQNISLTSGDVVICAFFISCGFGFLVAYFIDGQFGRRAENA